MRRGGHGRTNSQERDNATVSSAVHVESGRTVGTHVKRVALAAFSIAISILIWRLQPGRSSESRKNPEFVFQLYRKIVNGSQFHVGGAGHGRRIRADAYPTFDLHFPAADKEQFYIIIKLGKAAMPFHFHIDTASGSPWVHCRMPYYRMKPMDLGPNGEFWTTRDSIVSCLGLTASICGAMQMDKWCKASDQYKCKFSLEYGDGSRYLGMVVNERLTMPIQDGTERSVHAAFGCVLEKKFEVAETPLQTDGVAGLGRCTGSLLDQLATMRHIDRRVMSICFDKNTGQAEGRVGFVALGSDYDHRFPRTKSVWVELLGRGVKCQWNMKLLFISIDSARVKVVDADTGTPGTSMGFDTGTASTYLPKNVYDEVHAHLTTFTLPEEFRFFTVTDVDIQGFLDQRMCWEYRNTKRKRDDLRPTKSPIRRFPPLLLGFQRTTSSGAHILTVQPENYMSWNADESKLCVNFLCCRAGIHPQVGVEMLRGNLIVFDMDNKRVRWVPSSTC